MGITYQTTDQYDELFTTFISLFNQNKPINLPEWQCHGAINRHGYSSSACIDRVAQSLGKFSNDQQLSLDYRPYLQEICRLEESKQQVSGRKRFLHYLSQTNVGLARDDFGLLAKSTLAADVKTLEVAAETCTAAGTDNKDAGVKFFIDSQLYDAN